jgi:hypothetical protein
MQNDNERENFSLRLKDVLKAAGERIDSPTALARAFNRRYPGQPISVHAARKWLYGEAIPGQEKLRILASWLGCSNESLRFGGDLPQAVRTKKASVSALILDYELMRAISGLSEPHQEVVRILVDALRQVEST